MDDFWKDAEVVSMYTTDQAIEDGDLVEMTQSPAMQRLTYRYIRPDHRVVVTRGVFDLLAGEDVNDVQTFLANWQRVLVEAHNAGKGNPRDTLWVIFPKLDGVEVRMWIGLEGWSMSDGTPKLTFMLPEEY